MKIYIVTHTTGQFSDVSFFIDAVFKKEMDAQDYVSIEWAKILERRKSKLNEREILEMRNLRADIIELHRLRGIEFSDESYEEKQTRYRYLSGQHYDSEADSYSEFEIRTQELK